MSPEEGLALKARKRTIVLVAGTPGTDSVLATQRIVDYANAEGKTGKWLKFDKFEKLLLDAHNESNPSSPLAARGKSLLTAVV